MKEQVTDDLNQILRLFELTQDVTVPLSDHGGASMMIPNLSEVSALALALGFFLRLGGNRAQKLRKRKLTTFKVSYPCKENSYDRAF